MDINFAELGVPNSTHCLPLMSGLHSKINLRGTLVGLSYPWKHYRADVLTSKISSFFGHIHLK